MQLVLRKPLGACRTLAIREMRPPAYTAAKLAISDEVCWMSRSMRPAL